MYLFSHLSLVLNHSVVSYYCVDVAHFQTHPCNFLARCFMKLFHFEWKLLILLHLVHPIRHVYDISEINVHCRYYKKYFLEIYTWILTEKKYFFLCVKTHERINLKENEWYQNMVSVLALQFKTKIIICTESQLHSTPLSERQIHSLVRWNWVSHF